MQGLSESEAAERRRHGLGNDVPFRTTRTYLEILRQNAFTFVNVILFAISLILVLMGQHGDALVTAGLVLLNVVVGVYQESRAKRKLEQITLLARPQATIVRGGSERPVDPSEIVRGDLLVVRPGDQIIADGQLMGSGSIEVDQSMLTGESEPIPKQAGDHVYSGSFCIAGTGFYEAQKVGADSLINDLTARAQTFRQVSTPLQQDISLLIRVLVLLAFQLGLLLGISYALRGLSAVETVRMAAVIVTLVPQGLFFMTTVAYAMGAVRVAGHGALVQQSNAVESISYVNLLCLDKTGTLTTNRIEVHDIYPFGNGEETEEAELRRVLGDYAASTSSSNRTTQALLRACGGESRPIQREVLFSSEWKWSALSFDDPARPGAYYLGAPEAMMPHLDDRGDVPDIGIWAGQGLRVLLFARSSRPLSSEDAREEPQLPNGLGALALLVFSDELRLEARETLRHFSELGIALKVISGDHPQTVVTLAQQLGMGSDLGVLSGTEVDAMDEAQLAQAAEETTVFGRITPQQKERLIRVLHRLGYYIAMIGDGVNDVLSLKQARVGVAMQSGSAATRGVADVVLLGDSFAALPVAFREGQRIVKGMEDVVRLLLTRTLYVLLLVVATRLVGLPFPVTPKHNSVLAMLTVGIPILAIAAWARPGTPQRVIRSAAHFVVPAAFTISVAALAVYLAYLGTTGDVEVARTALTTVSVLCGLALIPFVEPPTAAFVGGDVFSGDWRPTLLALCMLLLLGAIMAVPYLRAFFELTLLGPWDYLILTSVAAAWAILLRFVWRARLVERFLDAEGL